MGSSPTVGVFCDVRESIWLASMRLVRRLLLFQIAMLASFKKSTDIIVVFLFSCFLSIANWYRKKRVLAYLYVLARATEAKKKTDNHLPHQPPLPLSERIKLIWGASKKLSTLLDLCVSSLRRGHANLLCIAPILTDDPRRESRIHILTFVLASLYSRSCSPDPFERRRASESSKTLACNCVRNL